MTKILIDEAVVRQALEALELEDMACRYEKDPTPEHIAKAITALRQALANEALADAALDKMTEQPAPAQPWVGLTDDERKKLADVIRFNNIWYLEDMLRAAEEMLERKNT